MTENRRMEMDRRLELIIGYTLRIGVITAAVLVLIGGGLYLVQHGSEAPLYHNFHGGPTHSAHLSTMVRNVQAFDCYGIIQLGLLVLIVTPIIRVMFSVIGFALEHDVLYVAVTLFVLAVLLYSLLAKGW